MAYIVALFHLGISFTLSAGVCVDIFFMISGFYLGRRFYTSSYCKENGITAWDFSLSHAKSIFPHYLYSMVVFFLYLLARQFLYLVLEPSGAKLMEILESIYMQIPDLLFMQSSFRFHETINYPTWQISAMLIGGYFVYASLYWNESFSRKIVFPAVILMEKSITNLDIDLSSNYGPLYLPLIRAFAPMALGVLTWYFWEHYGKAFLEKYGLASNLAAVFFILCLILFGNLAEIYWLTVPFVLVVCQWEDSWINRILNRECFRYFGAFSLAIYLNHALMERIVKALILPRMERLGHPLAMWQAGVVYIALLTVYSIFTTWLIHRWKQRKKTAQ